MLHLVASNELHNHREIRAVVAVDSNINFMSFLCEITQQFGSWAKVHCAVHKPRKVK